MLKNVTVILFSKDRATLLFQAIQSISACDVRLIVADGSAHPLNDFPKKSEKITYLHIPDVPFYVRLLEAFASLDTDYCILGTDDDRVSFETVAECASLLDKNPDIVRACGTTIHIPDFSKRGLRYAFPDLNVEKLLDTSNGTNHSSIERFKSGLRCNTQVFYSLTRSNVALAVVKLLSKLPDNAGILGELIWSHLPQLVGKTVLCDKLQMVRNLPAHKPRHHIYRASFSELRSLMQWDQFACLESSLISFSSEFGISQASMATVADLLNEKLFQPTNVSSEALMAEHILQIRLMRLFLFLINPGALRNSGLRWQTRTLAAGLANRARARCKGYPWIQPEDRIRAEQLLN